MEKMTKEMNLVPVGKLVPYVNNARTHSPEQIMKLRSSLREFGFVNPVIIDRDYNVLAGHGRLEAAKAEGIEEIPCVFADYLTEAQKKAYILADNRMAMDAGWDEELLRVEIEAFDESGAAIYPENNTMTFTPYQLRVSIDNLNIRTGAGTDHARTGKFTGKGIFTVIEEADGKGASKWGLLKAYQEKRDGWIALDFTEKC